MSNTYNGYALHDEASGRQIALDHENASGGDVLAAARQEEHEEDEVAVSSEVTEDKMFSYDQQSTESLTKRQMDMLHDQMKRYKAISTRHRELKASLMARAKENSYYPHRGLFFLGPQNAGEGMLGLNIGVVLWYIANGVT